MYTKANTGNEVSQELELITEKMAFEGRAIARPNRFVIFVDGALPGEKIRAEITQRKRHHAFARVLEVLEPSPHRVTAPCPVFGECGGCSFQQMDYPAQLAMKRDVLIESLYGVPGVPDNVCEAIGADSPFYFRNKMVFAFGSLNNELVLGLHRKGQWHSVVPADACMLQSKESNEIIRRVLAFVKERGIAVFNDEQNKGSSATWSSAKASTPTSAWRTCMRQRRTRRSKSCPVCSASSATRSSSAPTATCPRPRRRNKPSC